MIQLYIDAAMRQAWIVRGSVVMNGWRPKRVYRRCYRAPLRVVESPFQTTPALRATSP